MEQREKEILQIKKEIEDIKAVKAEHVTALENEINELKEEVREIDDQIKSKEQIVSDINSGKIPEITSKIAESYFPVNITPTNLSSPAAPVARKATVISEAVGDKFKIENRNGVLAMGQLLSNGNFLVLTGSTVSNNTAPKFQSSAPGAFKKRDQYTHDGTIDQNRRFTRDVEFNSKSGAASVILGDSADGNKQWRLIG